MYPFMMVGEGRDGRPKVDPLFEFETFVDACGWAVTRVWDNTYRAYGKSRQDTVCAISHRTALHMRHVRQTFNARPGPLAVQPQLEGWTAITLH